MNIDNCKELLAWLDAGAPHAVFDMHFDNISLSVFDDMELYQFQDQVDSKGIGSCGTVCCIAGAAAGLAAGDISKPLSEYGSWSETQNTALNWLGLPKGNERHGHDLFDPTQSPEDCTPAQAAEALRRVMRGEEAWS